MWKISKEHISNTYMDPKPSFHGPTLLSSSHLAVLFEQASFKASTGLGVFKGDVCRAFHSQKGVDGA